MTYFNLRKHTEPEPEEAVEEEQPEEAASEPEKEKPARQYGPILTGFLGPGAWIAAHFGTGPAWGIHVVAVWAVGFYGGWTAAGILLAWLAAVLAFTPRESLDWLAAWIEKRTGIHRAVPGETSDEPPEEDPPQPDPQDVVDLVRDVIGSDNGALLTGLCRPLHAGGTRAVREVLASAGIRVREGVRTAAGNGPGVHRDDVPPALPSSAAAPAGPVLAGEPANTNTNNTLRVQSREGMTIISDPADRHRTHTLKKP